MIPAGQFMPKKKNCNTLQFTPPGFKHPLDVLFPARSLPVCERCKKNFKTREHCRTRDCHTELPWADTYVCISLENPCIDKEGNLIDGPFVAKAVSPFAFNLKGDLDPKTPICAPCKEKNYTRTYCRQNKKHRQLPWSTIYVSLVPKGHGMYPEPFARPSPNSSSKRRKRNPDESSNSPEKAKKDHTSDQDKEDSSTPIAPAEDASNDNQNTERRDIQKEPEEKGAEEDETEREDSTDFFDEIPESRTFLVTVSTKGCHLQWVDTDPLNQPNYLQVRSDDNKASDDHQNGYHSPYNSMNSIGNGGHMGGMGMGGFGPSPYMDRGGMMQPFQGAFGNEGPMRPYMSPNSGMRTGGYGNFGPGGDNMGFDPRMRGDMGSGGGQTPTDDPQMLSGGPGGWGFNQQDHLMNRIRGFERMGMPYPQQMYGGFGGGGGPFPGGMHGGDGPMRLGFGRHGGNSSGVDGNSYGSPHSYNQGPAGPSPMERNQASIESAPPPKGNSSSQGGGSNGKTESSRGNADDDAKEV